MVGGVIPIQDLNSPSIGLGMIALISAYAVAILAWAPYIAFSIWTQVRLSSRASARPVAAFLFTALGLPFLAHPFAILAAGIFEQNGPLPFLFFFTGLVLVALLTRQLSWAAESRRQQSRQLLKLEQLSRDIMNSSPDASSLPILLREHVPSMFPSGRVAVWLENEGFLMNHPFDWEPDLSLVWNWLKEQDQAHCFIDKDKLPWDEQGRLHHALVLFAIRDVSTSKPIGCVYLELFSLAQPWDARSLANLFPAVQSLSAQIASARHQADIYEQALAYQRVTQELTLAGRIQASFLPDELPSMPGWELAVTLLPARETSGDFFDLIPLDDGKVGILIADVADKGVGAALYMALSRTLIRTYAIEFDEEEPQPEVVFFAANGRILNDARAELFVTAFYGILDPETGILTYCNAGHPPPFLLHNEGETVVDFLKATGMPIGIEEDQLWERQAIQILPGDALILYTDGVPDAQDSNDRFYEDKMLLEVVRSSRGMAAQDVQDLILTDLQEFSAGAKQFDDITLMVIGRDKEPAPVDAVEIPEGPSEAAD
jgi:serine phosphatase RsbU (regulator of sigma subunit)